MSTNKKNYECIYNDVYLIKLLTSKCLVRIMMKLYGCISILPKAKYRIRSSIHIKVGLNCFTQKRYVQCIGEFIYVDICLSNYNDYVSEPDLDTTDLDPDPF